MSLVSRFFTLVGAKISRLLGAAENPEETLDWSYEKMLENLVDVKRGVADVATAKKRLEIQLEGISGNGTKLEAQALQALAAGREDLARQALERKAFAEQQASGLQAQITKLAADQDRLVEAQKNAEQKIEAFRTEKEVMKANYSAAKAQVKIGEAATGLNRGMENTGLAIQRAKDKTEQMEARASAIEELTAAGSLEDFTSMMSGNTQLDRELAEISRSSKVDDDLARLRGELGIGEPAKQLEGTTEK